MDVERYKELVKEVAASDEFKLMLVANPDLNKKYGTPPTEERDDASLMEQFFFEVQVELPREVVCLPLLMGSYVRMALQMGPECAGNHVHNVLTLWKVPERIARLMNRGG